MREFRGRDPPTLNAAQRLKQRKKIDALFASGQKFSVADLRAVYQLMPAMEQSGLLIGVGVSKRFFKKAVDRNRIKRRMREAIRLLRPALVSSLEAAQKELHIFVLFTGKELPDFASCNEMMQQVVNRLIRKLNA